MKNVLVLFCLTIFFSCNSGKNDPFDPAIKELPDFDITLLDSSNISSKALPTDKALIIVYFNTDCDHCHQETKALLKNIDSLKNAQLIFLTGMPLPDLKQFSDDYKLTGYKNITVGRDFQHSFARKFRPAVVPYMAIYNKDRALVTVYVGDTEFKKVFAAIQS